MQVSKILIIMSLLTFFGLFISSFWYPNNLSLAMAVIIFSGLIAGVVQDIKIKQKMKKLEAFYFEKQGEKFDG